MKRMLVVACLAGLVVPALVFAGGPVYSRFGIGDLSYFGGSRSYSMGGVGIGLYGDSFINQLNPAGLAGLTFTRFSGSLEYSNYSSTDGLSTGRYARGDFSGLSVAIPVAKDYGVVLFGEMAPYSSVNYAVNSSDSQLGIESTQQFFGSGGILRFDIGSSVSVSNSLHLGFKANYLAGTILQNTKVAFTDNSYDNYELDRQFYYSGFMFTFGATYQGLGDLLGVTALKPLVLGVVAETPANLDSRQQNFSSTASAYDTTYTQYGKTDIPLFLALGASYTFADRYVVAADYATQNWSNATTFGNHQPEFRTRTRMGGGIEIRPAKDASSYWGHVYYRAGFYYDATYLQVLGQGVNGMYGAAGIGLPIGPESYLDIGLRFGVNGTTVNGLQQDKIFRLSVSISGSELWFNRYEED